MNFYLTIILKNKLPHELINYIIRLLYKKCIICDNKFYCTNYNICKKCKYKWSLSLDQLNENIYGS